MTPVRLLIVTLKPYIIIHLHIMKPTKIVVFSGLKICFAEPSNDFEFGSDISSLSLSLFDEGLLLETLDLLLQLSAVHELIRYFAFVTSKSSLINT